MNPGLLRREMRRAEWFHRSAVISNATRERLEAPGLPARLGELCEVLTGDQRPAIAEVVGLRDGRAILVPYSDPSGLRLGTRVVATGRFASIDAGDGLIGRVIDAFGRPLDDGPRPIGLVNQPLYPPPMPPETRGLSGGALTCGVRAIDALLALAKGQRIGIFAGSGVGKSTLLGMMARSLAADVLVVGLIGERGREAREFMEKGLDPSVRARSVILVATSDEPAIVRSRAAYAATAIAEHFCEAGHNVCLVMDSISRFAMAQREIGLASGEMPTVRGYTPGVFAAIPRLLERGGVRGHGGSLSGIYSVLVDGDDLMDPIADTCRAVLDGHVVLNREIFERGRRPAIDVPQSISRLMLSVVSAENARIASEVRELIALYESAKDLIEVGVYRSGSNSQLDRAIRIRPDIEAFLTQAPGEITSQPEAFERLRAILKSGRADK